MRKLLSMLLVLVMALGMTSVAMAEAADYKIAIITGTVTQNEEEIRAAERQQAKTPENIVLDTYPDNFTAEMETTISKIVAFAMDPDVKAIIVAQAVPGTKAAFDKIKEMGRDDILTFAVVPQETPDAISASSDLVFYANEAAQGDTIMETLDEWGVDVFIHYSFPRHMAMETIVARHEVLKQNAEALGIDMVDVTAPDPTTEGTPVAQQFILEDVPQQLKKYDGKKVAFFSTNCSMQPPLQEAILDQANAYYPQPCCPSPYHAFPATLGLELQMGGDDKAAIEQIAQKLAEHDAVSRYSTWETPLTMALIDVSCEYARGYIAGEITSRNDAAVVSKLFDELVKGSKVDLYTNVEGKTLDNYYVAALAPIDFNEYLAK